MARRARRVPQAQLTAAGVALSRPSGTRRRTSTAPGRFHHRATAAGAAGLGCSAGRRRSPRSWAAHPAVRCRPRPCASSGIILNRRSAPDHHLASRAIRSRFAGRWLARSWTGGEPHDGLDGGGIAGTNGLGNLLAVIGMTKMGHRRTGVPLKVENVWRRPWRWAAPSAIRSLRLRQMTPAISSTRVLLGRPVRPMLGYQRRQELLDPRDLPTARPRSRRQRRDATRCGALGHSCRCCRKSAS